MALQKLDCACEVCACGVAAKYTFMAGEEAGIALGVWACDGEMTCKRCAFEVREVGHGVAATLNGMGGRVGVERVAFDAVARKEAGCSAEGSARADKVAEGCDGAFRLCPDFGGCPLLMRGGVAGVGELVGAEGGALAGELLRCGFDEGEVFTRDFAFAPPVAWGTRRTSAPRARIICARSGELPSLMTAMKGWPKTPQTMARPVPMLPEVSSTTVWASASSPEARADWMTARAARSFLEKPGLR